MKDITLYPSRVKSGFLLFISSLFTVTGIWMIMETGSWKGWLAAVFFGICTVVFVINLLPGKSYLKLTAEGFEVSSLAKKYFLKWTDVAGFGVSSIGMNKMVVFNYAPSYAKAKNGRNISRSVAGWEGGLHDTFGMKAEKLMNLMNAYQIAAHNASYQSNEHGQK
jgi:hypothetical protein